METAASSQRCLMLPRRERPASIERTGAQLFIRHAGSHASDESLESSVSKLGHSLRRGSGLRTTPSWRMAREDQRTRRAPPRRVLLPATRCLAGLASPGATPPVGGGEEA